LSSKSEYRKPSFFSLSGEKIRCLAGARLLEIRFEFSDVLPYPEGADVD
jgi:hypothetical protein